MDLISDVAKNLGWKVTWGAANAVLRSQPDFNTTVSFICQPDTTRVRATLTALYADNGTQAAAWCVHACRRNPADSDMHTSCQ